MAETSEPSREQLHCGRCGGAIVCCEFCDEVRCPKAMCYGCIIVALGEAAPQPHTHGG